MPPMFKPRAPSRHSARPASPRRVVARAHSALRRRARWLCPPPSRARTPFSSSSRVRSAHRCNSPRRPASPSHGRPPLPPHLLMVALPYLLPFSRPPTLTSLPSHPPAPLFSPPSPSCLSSLPPPPSPPHLLQLAAGCWLPLRNHAPPSPQSTPSYLTSSSPSLLSPSAAAGS
ncbi:unnamed protein product [Closterium sp. Naga37s-1]|nr:unnamed protein product [Closterium sp. Naga37s-1]